MWFNELRQRWLGRPRTGRKHRQPVQRPNGRRLNFEPLEHRTLLTVTIPTLSPSTLPADIAGVSYDQVITASGGSGTVKLAVNVTSAINGFTVPASGTGSLTISGTATTTGTEAFTVTATDSAGKTIVPYSITVMSLTPAPPTLPADTVGVPYSYNQTFTASGGTGPVTLTSNLTNVPWLTATSNANGSLTIGGTPTAPATAGTETFTVTATDSENPPATASAKYSVTVNPLPSATPATLPADTLGATAPYSQTITASGGTGTVTLTSNLTNVPWLTATSIANGSLTISGTPTTTGTETFTVTATDSLKAYTTTTYSITVNSPPSLSPTLTTLPADTVYVPYSQTITASGGTGAVTLTSNLASVPWLTVPPSGTGSLAISGTPTATGTETFTVTATDSLGATTSATYSITANSLPAALISPAASASDLITDILWCNQNPGMNTITLAANSNFEPIAADNAYNSIGSQYPTGQYGPTALPYIAAGDNLTILGNGDTIERTGAACRLFAVAPTASLTLENLTLQGGWADGRYNSTLPPAAADGGAIYVDSTGSLTLSGVTVTGNEAFGALGYDGANGEDAAGGGIYSNGGSVLLEAGTLITNNTIYAGLAYNAGTSGPGGNGGDAMGGGVCAIGGNVIATGGVIVSNNKVFARDGGPVPAAPVVTGATEWAEGYMPAMLRSI